MALILDAVTLAIILLCLLVGYKNGFVKTAYRLFRTIISFVAALVFAKPFSAFIASTDIFKSFVDNLYGKVDKIVLDIPVTGDVPLDGALSESSVTYLADLGVTLSELGEKISSLISAGEENIRAGIKEYVLAPAAESLAYAVAFVLLFIAASLALRIICAVLEGTVKVAGLGGVNSVFGLLLGACGGIIYALIFCCILTALMPYISTTDIGITAETAQNTYLFKRLSEFGMSLLFGA